MPLLFLFFFLLYYIVAVIFQFESLGNSSLKVFFFFFFLRKAKIKAISFETVHLSSWNKLQLFALKLHFPIYTRQALTETRLKLCGILIMRYIFWKSCRPMLQTSVSEQRNLYRRSRELHVCMWFIGMEWNLLWKR